jgi:hypothetical protein
MSFRETRRTTRADAYPAKRTGTRQIQERDRETLRISHRLP